MTINQLVDLLADYVAAGHGNAEVLIGVTRLGQVAGRDGDDRLSSQNWTVSGITDETRERFVLLDVEVAR